ncbi:MarR family transcriptional regulator [Rhodococcus sp. NPDC047139]|uniref:MarR family winged helix-turn-helix transcriptional regulator n=1 Tax=Rhodococcus sp. NPDC047139 TaxID=3155141 RepID=UPI0033ED6604
MLNVRGGDDDLDEWPTGRLLSTAARLVEQAWEQSLRQQGLTHAGVIALQAVSRAPCSQRQMARACRVTDQTMSRTVDHLVRGGFVTRTVDPDDERRMRVEITPSGVEAYRRVIEIERDDSSGGDSPVAVSDPATLRRLLLEIVRSHRTAPDTPRSTPGGDGT